MHDKSPAKTTTNRRTLLKTIGLTTATAGLLGTSLHSATAQEQSFVVEQGDTCASIRPITYQEQSVEEFYNYTDDENADRPPWESNTPLQVAEWGVSRLFLYRGPDGLSLVVIHDRGGNGSGGAASFTISGLPENGEWVIRDDDHPEDPDDWNISEDETVTNWSWNQWHTDGGAFLGLSNEFEITIEPSFNGDAELDPETPGAVDRWEAVSQNGDELETTELQLDEPVTIRNGTCE